MEPSTILWAVFRYWFMKILVFIIGLLAGWFLYGYIIHEKHRWMK